MLDRAPARPALARCARVFKHKAAVVKWLSAVQASSRSAHRRRPSAPAIQARSITSELYGEKGLRSAAYGLLSCGGSCVDKSKAAIAATEAKAQASYNVALSALYAAPHEWMGCDGDLAKADMAVKHHTARSACSSL